MRLGGRWRILWKQCGYRRQYKWLMRNLLRLPGDVEVVHHADGVTASRREPRGMPWEY